MAKISGAKNPGAWYRANKLIQQLSGLERTALGALIVNSNYIESAFEALLALAEETGVNAGLDTPSDSPAWVASMLADGIPWQIWNGRLTFTTYTLSDGVYVANYQSPIHFFAKDLRKIVRRFSFARHEIRDVYNLGHLGEGNPGGIPDTDPTQ